MKTFDFILKHYQEAPELMEAFKEQVIDYLLILEDKEDIEQALNYVLNWEEWLYESEDKEDNDISIFIYKKLKKNT
jgi:hypothetical protein